MSQELSTVNNDNSILLELIEKIVNIIGVTKTNINNVLNNMSKQFFYNIFQNKIPLKKYLQLLQILNQTGIIYFSINFNGFLYFWEWIYKF